MQIVKGLCKRSMINISPYCFKKGCRDGDRKKDKINLCDRLIKI